MNKIQIIESLIVNTLTKFKTEKKRKEEMRYLINYISSSSLFNGDKKKIYKIIKKYSKK